MTAPIKNVLIANRGEIACRVIRTVQALGLRAIAVYSEADADAPHVAMADAAALIGPATAAASYLHIQNILEAAGDNGADALHPGYGFLAENETFARACEEAGLVFIGPTPEAIALMGNKAAAKRRMIEAGVPCVPGYEDADQSDEVFIEAANDIGYPVMVKAAAGGGGRGMRLVADSDELGSALRLARSEAESAFGSGELILEKAILRPRHVEFQVMADAQGQVIHLGERDCSVQRRHQKVVEEAPCPVMTDELREQMGQAAVDAARSINYRGAGTVEFLLDENGEFYFLEMNTRLQVEHPVTELITRLDLVELQIRVANGEPLGIDQHDVALIGHAIEVRLYAEDPAADFRPSAGMIDLWRPPQGEGIRVDAGIETGLEVSPFYDPLLAKVIAWGETREIARNRLVNALSGTVLFGPKTNREFLIDVLGKDKFITGEATTALIAEAFDPATMGGDAPSFEHAAVAAVLEFRAARESAYDDSIAVSPSLKNWGSSGRLITHCIYENGDSHYDLTVTPRGIETYCVAGGDDERVITVSQCDDEHAELLIDGRKVEVAYCIPDPARIHVSVSGRQVSFSDRIAVLSGDDEAAMSGKIFAPMHGQLQEVFVQPGDTIEKGARLVVLEAMKMQHEILAEVAGVVELVHYEVGTQVAADALILEITTDDGAAPPDA